MFSRIPNTISPYCGCFPQFGPPLTEFRLQFVSISYLLLTYMANPATDDVLRLLPTRSSTTSIHGPDSHLPPDDPTSASYIPRAARMTPTSTTVHTIFIKKLSYPFSSRPDELWILERTLDGIETWKPVETFLENMHLTRDRATLRTTANHWRQYYDIPIQSSSSSTATSVPVLPHPEHTNVHVSQPYEAIPDQLHILQSCWGRSAQHHSQGTTISLSWPPWRSTPPLPHHRQHFTGPYTRITLPHLFIILIVHYLRTNLALWICLTPVCNTPHHFAKRKKTECRLVTIYCVPCFVLLPCHDFCFPIYRNQQYSYLQPGLNAWNSTPWLTLLVLTHIALHPGLIHHRVPELLHGLLDIEAFLVMWTLLHTDPS